MKMETLSILFGGLLCLVVIECRHLDHHEDSAVQSDDNLHDLTKNYHNTDSNKHRRRRWNNNYGYEYPSSGYPFQYPDRRDYDRNQDYLPKIVRLLEEISSYVRRPPPPPQPIYIPYPVAYPVPQYAPCTSNVNNNSKLPNVTNRWPDMEDPNQNWGFVPPVEDVGTDTANDGARPISFDPIRPLRPLKRPVPSVEHGSSQGDILHTTRAPLFGQAAPAFESETKNVGVCSAAILSCCADTDPYKCFLIFNCAASYNNGAACTRESIASALESFRQAYAPAAQ